MPRLRAATVPISADPKAADPAASAVLSVPSSQSISPHGPELSESLAQQIAWYKRGAVSTIAWSREPRTPHAPRVDALAHCKEHTAHAHEYLLFRLRRPDGQAWWARAERADCRAGRSLGALLANLAADPARDAVFPLPPGAGPPRADVLAEYTFADAPLALELFAAVLRAASEARRARWSLHGQWCFWYAGVVFDAVRTFHGGRGVLVDTGRRAERGCVGGVRMCSVDDAGFYTDIERVGAASGWRDLRRLAEIAAQPSQRHTPPSDVPPSQHCAPPSDMPCTISITGARFASTGLPRAAYDLLAAEHGGLSLGAADMLSLEHRGETLMLRFESLCLVREWIADWYVFLPEALRELRVEVERAA